MTAPTIYVASSWRNEIQPQVVVALRLAGFDVYDFKDPKNDKGAFKWSDLGIDRPEDWSPQQCVEFLAHPRAEEGFRQDFDAMRRSAACVLVLPAGRSANLEAGRFVGQGRPLVVLKDWGCPDLMYKMATRVVTTVDEAVKAVRDEFPPAFKWPVDACPVCGADGVVDADESALFCARCGRTYSVDGEAI